MYSGISKLQNLSETLQLALFTFVFVACEIPAIICYTRFWKIRTWRPIQAAPSSDIKWSFFFFFFFLTTKCCTWWLVNDNLNSLGYKLLICVNFLLSLTFNLVSNCLSGFKILKTELIQHCSYEIVVSKGLHSRQKTHSAPCGSLQKLIMWNRNNLL